MNVLLVWLIINVSAHKFSEYGGYGSHGGGYSTAPPASAPPSYPPAGGYGVQPGYGAPAAAPPAQSYSSAPPSQPAAPYYGGAAAPPSSAPPQGSRYS